MKKACMMVIAFLVVASIGMVFNASSCVETCEMAFEEGMYTDSGSPDVPTWMIGTSWTYEQDFLAEGNGRLELEEELTFTVIGIETIFRGIPVYRVDLEGEVFGGGGHDADNNPLTIDEGYYTGYALYRMDNLALIYDYQYRYLEGRRHSPLLPRKTIIRTETHTTYSPSLDSYDFPITPGSTFTREVNVNRTGWTHVWVEDLVDENTTIHEDKNYLIDAGVGQDTVPVTTQAGTFDTFAVTHHESGDDHGEVRLHYNGDVQNNVREIVDRDVRASRDRILISYNIPTNPNSMHLEPSQVTPGDTVTVTGNFPGHALSEFTVSIPMSGFTQDVTTDSNGRFTVDIQIPDQSNTAQAPEILCNLGVVARLKSDPQDAYQVATLTVFEGLPSPPTDPQPANGQEGVSSMGTVQLSVYAEHLSGKAIDMYFYDENHEIIGSTTVESGTRASVNWDGISYGRTYRWYAVAHDGTHEVSSEIWEFTTVHHPDIPTWRIGTTWTYDQDFLDEGNGRLELETELTFTVIGIETIFRGIPVYRVDLEGEVFGGGGHDGDGNPLRIDYGYYSGYALYRMDNLALIYDYQYRYLEGAMQSPIGQWRNCFIIKVLHTTYSPPLDSYDFPIIPGSTFSREVNVNRTGWIRVMTSGLPDINTTIHEDKNYLIDAGVGQDTVPVTTPAGTFDTFMVTHHESGDDTGLRELYYCGTVQNNVKEVVVRQERANRSRSLSSYHVPPNPNSLEPSHVPSGDTVTVIGNFPGHALSEFTVSIPMSGFKQDVTTDVNGTFSIEFQAPSAADMALSSCITRKYGIVARLKSDPQDAYQVATLTVFEGSPYPPSDPHPVDGAKGLCPLETVELSVLAMHHTGDDIDMYFYDGDHDLIGSTTVESGTRASVNWDGISYGRTYRWYAVAHDGTHEVSSKIWEFSTVHHPDMPSWPIGSTWTYDQTFTMDTEQGELHLVEELTYTITSIEEIDIDGVMTPFYRMELAGNVINGTAPGESRILVIESGFYEGYALYRVDDLALYYDYQLRTLEGELRGVFTRDAIIRTETHTIYSPPLDSYDLPITPGNTFSRDVNVNRTGWIHVWVDGLVDDNRTIHEDNNYLIDAGVGQDTVPVTTPAGTFDPFMVSHNESGDDNGTVEMYFDMEVRNNVKEVVVRGERADRTRVLRSYHIPGDENSLWTDPSEAHAGETVTVMGEFPDHPSTEFEISVPASGFTDTIQSDAHGMFTMEIQVPAVRDDNQIPGVMGRACVSARLSSDPHGVYKVVFLTVLEGPIRPTDPEPTDGEADLRENVDLSVYVYHHEVSTLAVRFYDASDDSLIGETEAPSGSRAVVTWNNLEFGKGYDWYAVADDGTYSSGSGIWRFTTSHYHVLTIDVEGEGSTDPTADLYTHEHGVEITVTATPAHGWSFSHWAGDPPPGEEHEHTISLVMDNHKELTAHFKINLYNLVIDVVGEGSTEPGMGTDAYEYGSLVTVKATPAEGWTFSHWHGDVPPEYEESSELTLVMNDHKTLVAHFQEIYHELTIASVGEGSTDPAEGVHSYVHGYEVRVTATPADGWIFSHWTGDVPQGEVGDEEIQVIMDGDKMLTAHFDEIVLPVVEITSPSDGYTFDTSNVTIQWQSSEGTYPVTRYEIRLDEGNWVDVGTDEEYTFIDLMDGSYLVSVKVVDAGGYVHECSLIFTVSTTVETGFEPGNMVLNVEPKDGKAPLEVTITVSASNSGTEEGSLEVTVDDTVIHTLEIPPGNDTRYEFTYTFQDTGTYHIGFGDLTETVMVTPEDTPSSDDNIGTTQSGSSLWFIPLLGIVAILIAMIVYIAKSRRPSMESFMEEDILDPEFAEEEDPEE